MSTSIVAAPDSSLNVRYTRKVQENRGAGEENQVEILEDEEHHADLGSQKAGKSENDCFKIRYWLIIHNSSINPPLVSIHYRSLSGVLVL